MNEKIVEELYKCSKCGLCKSVCPIYLATKNEMFSPRGRYIVLNKFVNDSKKLSKKFTKDIDVCLNCNLCKNFCPSDIDTNKIHIKIKEENLKYQLKLPFSIKYKLFLIFCNVPLFEKFLFQIMNLTHPIKSNKITTNKKSEKNVTKGNVLFFEGCFNKYIDSTDKCLSINLIENLGYSVKNVISNCCGYPLLVEGNVEKYLNNAKDIISKISPEVDYIVCSCDTCYDTLIKIFDYMPDEKNIKNKIITLDEFLNRKNYQFASTKDCFYFKTLLKSEYSFLESKFDLLNQKGLCSTMENFFRIKYPKLTKKIILENSKKLELANDKFVITTCNITKLGLISSFSEIDCKTKVLSLSEYINLLSEKK